MIKPFEIIGFLGNIFLIIAYAPQIVHLIKKKNSAGLSQTAWFIWLLGDICLFIYSISISDRVFITLNSSFILLTLTGIILIHKYRSIS